MHFENKIITMSSENLSSKKELAELFIDIETSGSNQEQNILLSIGWYLTFPQNPNLKPVKKRVSMNADGTTRNFDVNCQMQFWNKHPTVLSTLVLESTTIELGMREFVNDLDSYDSKYEVTIFCDNPAFDIGFINTYLAMYMKRGPLSTLYGNQATYRPIVDTDSFIDGVKIVLGTSYRQYAPPQGVQHNHYPDDDAENNYFEYMHAKRMAFEFHKAHNMMREQLHHTYIISDTSNYSSYPTN